MTHEQAIDIVLEYALLQTKDDSLVEEAKRHIATCHQCWIALGDIHNLVFDQHLPELTQAQHLLACRDIRPRIWEVADIPEDRVEKANPVIGAHVKSCNECRQELAALREALADDRSAAESPTDVWRLTGKRIFELPGSIVVAVWTGLANLLEHPVGVVAEALTLEPEPTRGGMAMRGPLRARGLERILFVVELTETCHLPAASSLRVFLTQHSPTERLWGGDTLSNRETRVEFADLIPGEYTLEFILKPEDLTLHVPLCIKQQEIAVMEQHHIIHTRVPLPETPYEVRLKWIAASPV